MLFLLTAYIIVAALLTLLGYNQPRATFMGIAILVAAVVIMPLLAKEKGRLSQATGRSDYRERLNRFFVFLSCAVFRVRF